MTTDKSIIEPFLKILALEEEQGYQDRAVAGGLDKLLHRWDSDLSQIIGEFKSYSILTPSQRKQWAKINLQKVLDSSGLTTSVKPKAPKHSAQQKKRKPTFNSIVTLESKVTVMKGIGEQLAKKLYRLNIDTIEDLIYHFPSKHNDYSAKRQINQLAMGETQTVVVDVWDVSASVINPKRNLWSIQADIGDDTGMARANWIRPGVKRNQRPYLANSLKTGDKIVVSGKVSGYRGTPFFKDNPEFENYRDVEQLIHTARRVPVYSTVEGISQRSIRRLIKTALDATSDQIIDHLPPQSINRTNVLGLKDAITQIHYPESQPEFNRARHRLAFDELLLLQLIVLMRKNSWQQEEFGIPLESTRETIDPFISNLPFNLTVAQNRVLDEILNDFKQNKPMNRLLQGDVGSGKTIIASASLIVATLNGYQGTLMAPTEVLAEQHFLTITKQLGCKKTGDGQAEVSIAGLKRPIKIALLHGSVKKKTKTLIRDQVSIGKIDILIGTHAVIQDDVKIPQLAVAIVDEQHRFGVMQRSSLIRKGKRPHILSMSATPIPRSLAKTLYGELDISTIDELPPGRLRIRTRWVEPNQRDVAYGFVAKQVEQKRQAFIVCPLIDGSETIQTRAATEEYARLSSQVFPEYSMGLLHGRLSLDEKNIVMNRFKEGDLDILVSTPVIEVGIDVPNATVMLIDGADRFGLAQLHQFRGRVGRGIHQSYCILLSDNAGEEAQERLKLVERIQDGFELAESDLNLRGPGDYLGTGTRQSGLPPLKIAKITDHEVVTIARQEATHLLEIDPNLSGKDKLLLSKKALRLAEISINQ